MLQPQLRILLTGATGLIGKEVGKALTQAGHHVVAVSRNRAKAMGLHLLADHTHASNTVTAVLTPEGINTKALLKILRERDHIVLGGGQEHLDGKMFRVGHLGFFQESELVEAMDAVEKRLREFGFKG